MLDVRLESVERLRQLWALGSADLGLLRALVAALVREDRQEEALALARDALTRQVLNAREVSQALGGYLSECWQGRNGGRFEGRLRGINSEPKVAWRWTSPDPHDTFGKPLCVGFGRAAALLQNTVVGMRFERLVVLDLATGALVWERERKGLAFSGALAWFGDGPSLGWPYVVAEDGDGDDEEDKWALCLERFDLATGQTLGIERLDVSAEPGLEPGAELTAWEDRYGWLLKWRDERSALAFFDRQTGAFLGLEPLAVAAREVTTVAGETFAVDDTGLVRVEGARVEDVVFRVPTRARGAQRSWRIASITDLKPFSLFAQGGFHFLMTQPRALRAGWVMLSERFTVFAASPTGEALCRESGADALVVMRVEEHGPVALYHIEMSCRPAHRVASLRAAWMGGDWVIMMGCGGMLEGAAVFCINGDNGALKWRCEVPMVWHQGPIPIQGGVLGVSGEGVVFLTDM